MYVSYVLLALFVLVFILQLAVAGFTEFLIFDPGNLALWTFISAVFLHGGVTHLFFNSFALIIFGPYLERVIGRRQFITLFFLAGIAGSALYLLTIYLGIVPPRPALGASGAIYGILGALTILTPGLVVYLYFVPMPIRYAAVLWIIFETIGSFNPYSGIGSAAHLGGLLFGIAFGLWYKNQMRPPSAGEWYSTYLR